MPIERQNDLPCSCSRTLDVLAPEEEEVLRRMRALREQADALRKLLASEPGPGAAAAVDAQQRLALLREAFDDCKRELEAANRIKLRRLGHIP